MMHLTLPTAGAPSLLCDVMAASSASRTTLVNRWCWQLPLVADRHWLLAGTDRQVSLVLASDVYDLLVHYCLLLSSGRRPPVCQSLAAACVSGRWVKSGPRQSLVADCWPLVVAGGLGRLLTASLSAAGGRWQSWSPADGRC